MILVPIDAEGTFIDNQWSIPIHWDQWFNCKL